MMPRLCPLGSGQVTHFVERSYAMFLKPFNSRYRHPVLVLLALAAGLTLTDPSQAARWLIPTGQNQSLAIESQKVVTPAVSLMAGAFGATEQDKSADKAPSPLPKNVVGVWTETGADEGWLGLEHLETS